MIESNETGFTKANVDALCDVGKSTKSGQCDSTGEKGIGFKSIFKAVTSVHVSSNGYTFELDRRRPCGMVVPLWKDFPAHLKNPGHTQFLLKFSSFGNQRQVLSEITSLDPKTILFLRKLRRIETIIDGVTRVIVRDDDQRYGVPTATLRIQTAATMSVHQEYLLVRKIVKVTVPNQKRQGLTTTQIVLAFPMSSIEGEPQRAYNFLPIRYTEYPFSFHADFILNASREDLDTCYELWNTMLLKGTARAFSSGVKLFNSIPQLQFIWPQYLPATAGSKGSFSRLASYIQSRLRAKPVCYCENEELHLASDTYFVPRAYRSSTGKALIDLPFSSLHNLSPFYGETVETELSWLGARRLDSSLFLKEATNYVNLNYGALFQEQSQQWHIDFARALLACDIDDTLADVDGIMALPLIPLRNGSWVSAKSGKCFFPPTGVQGLDDVPEGIAAALLIASAACVSGPQRDLFARLGVKSMDQIDVCDKIIETHSRQDPPELSKQQLISHALYLFAFSMTRKIDLKFPRLWVTCVDGSVRLAGNLYQDGITASVSKFLLGGPKQNFMLHSDMITAVSAGRQNEWIGWLKKTCGITDILRLVSEGMLTPEFKHVAMTGPSTLFLRVLTDQWEQLASLLKSEHPKGLTRPDKSHFQLSSVVVDTTSGLKKSLCSLALPRASVWEVARDDLEYLLVDEPDDERWLCLQELGVLVSADACHFQMRSLQMLSGTTPDMDKLKAVYASLATHFGGNAMELR